MIDPKGQTTSWTYDALGRLISKSDASGTSLSFGYDANDRLISRWSYARGTTFYSYDAAGNLTYVNYPSSPDVAYSYDPLHRLVNMWDSATGTTTFTYNNVGALQAEDGPWASDTVIYDYDSNHRRRTLTLTAPAGPGWSQSYSYDSAGRLQSIQSPAGLVGYSYTTPAALISRISLPNGASIHQGYDGLGRLNSTGLRNSSGTVLNTHDYLYNDAHQRTREARLSNQLDFSYDPLGQLVGVRGAESTGAARWHEQLAYTYDNAGNLIHRSNNGLSQSFGFHSRNQISYIAQSGSLTVSGLTAHGATSVSVNGQPASLYADDSFAAFNLPLSAGTFTATAQNSGGTASDTISLPVATYIYPSYDGNGNLVWDGQKYFDYDDDDRLVRVHQPGQWQVEFAYDGFSRRRWRRDYIWNSTGASWQLTGETRYIYDGQLVLQERDSSNNPWVTYTRGIDLSGQLQGAGGIGGLLARTDPDGTAYYHGDGSGNITALIDSAQQIVARYLYDPFGNLLGASGPLAQANLYRFSSKEFHPTANLYYYGFRYYEPNLQRWLNRDPIGEAGGVNLYGFNFNSPVNWVDTDGALPNLVSGGVGAGIGAITGAIIGGWQGGWRGALKGAAAGAVGGFVGGVTFNPAAGAAAAAGFGTIGSGLTAGAASGAAAGFSGGVLDELLRDKSPCDTFRWTHVGWATGLGAAAGAPLGGVGVKLGRGAVKSGTIYWNPMNGPGPLGEKVAATFRGASYTESITSEGITLYRVYGGKAAPLGSYWTRTPPAGPLQSRIDNALLPQWGNTADNVARIRVSPGIRIFEGYAAPQGALVGGGSQVFIPRIDPTWMIK